LDGDYVVVAFQRALMTENHPRIGIYDTVSETWGFVYYPLDKPTSQYEGGWVGLSDISPLPGDGEFLVLERDNRAGHDASIKKIYKISLDYDSIDFTVDATPMMIIKTEFRDLMDDLAAPKGPIPEKVEGLAVDQMGHVWIVNDNDGVDDTSGEQQLLDLGMLVDMTEDNDEEPPEDDDEEPPSGNSGSCGSTGTMLVWIPACVGFLFLH
jgi:hypothetical protein